jgi:RHS repeat-associated protein
MSDDYRQYRYDLLNRLTEVLRYQDGDLVPVARYGYDINSLRIYKENGEGITTRYVYDATGNRLETHTEETSSYYIFRGLRHAARRIVDNATQEEVRHYYGTDHLGSTVLVTGEAGEVLWTGETNPFGDNVSGGGTGSGESERIKYTGKDFDEDAGLYYFNARWYDPGTGRFITEDPARDGISWYAYVANNPLRYVDPSGLEKEHLLTGLTRYEPTDSLYLGWGTQDREFYLSSFQRFNPFYTVARPGSTYESIVEAYNIRSDFELSVEDVREFNGGIALEAGNIVNFPVEVWYAEETLYLAASGAGGVNQSLSSGVLSSGRAYVTFSNESGTRTMSAEYPVEITSTGVPKAFIAGSASATTFSRVFPIGVSPEDVFDSYTEYFLTASYGIGLKIAGQEIGALSIGYTQGVTDNSSIHDSFIWSGLTGEAAIGKFTKGLGVDIIETYYGNAENRELNYYEN